MIRYFLVAAVVALVLSPSAWACINDRETMQMERQFKSNYEFKSTFQEQPRIETPAGDNQIIAYGGTGLGAALLLGALCLGLVKTRS